MSDNSEGFRARPDAESIPCPFLTTAYNHGDLVPDDDGTVSATTIDETMARYGIVKGLRSRLAKAVAKADGDASDTSFNLFKLRDSGLDHTGSTGIRDPKVDPSQVPTLLSFGENGRMYREHFAKAARHYSKEDPGAAGSIQEMVDMAALLEVFGRTDEKGKRYLSDEDVRRLWVEGKYPEGWTRPEPDSVGAEIFASAGLMCVERVAEGVQDFFERGKDRATGEP